MLMLLDIIKSPPPNRNRTDYDHDCNNGKKQNHNIYVLNDA